MLAVTLIIFFLSFKYQLKFIFFFGHLRMIILYFIQLIKEDQMNNHNHICKMRLHFSRFFCQAKMHIKKNTFTFFYCFIDIREFLPCSIVKCAPLHCDHITAPHLRIYLYKPMSSKKNI